MLCIYIFICILLFDISNERERERERERGKWLQNELVFLLCQKYNVCTSFHSENTSKEVLLTLTSLETFEFEMESEMISSIALVMICTLRVTFHNTKK